MTPTNEAILKMVLASPVGKAMSPADREALRMTLETIDAREVQGWLGDQIRKAATVAKGDYEGHPFRGNQWTDASGVGTGGARGRQRNVGGLAGPNDGEARYLGLGRGQRDRAMGGSKPFKPEITTMFSDADNKIVAAALKQYVKDNPDIVKGFSSEDIRAIQEYAARAGAGKEVMDSAVREDIAQQLLNEAEARGITPTKETHPDTYFPPSKPKEVDRVTAAGERAMQAERDKMRAEREQAASEQRRSKLVPVNEDNIDKPLKGEEAARFRADRKGAVAALKDTVKLIGQMRAKAANLPTEARREAFTLLQEALERTDDYASVLADNTRATIRSAAAIYAIGADVAEQAKGALYEADELITRGIGRQGGTAAARMAALQSASDKDFGVSGDKYDIESAFDLLDR